MRLLTPKLTHSMCLARVLTRRDNDSAMNRSINHESGFKCDASFASQSTLREHQLIANYKILHNVILTEIPIWFKFFDEKPPFMDEIDRIFLTDLFPYDFHTNKRSNCDCTTVNELLLRCEECSCWPMVSQSVNELPFVGEFQRNSSTLTGLIRIDSAVDFPLWYPSRSPCSPSCNSFVPRSHLSGDRRTSKMIQ